MGMELIYLQPLTAIFPLLIISIFLYKWLKPATTIRKNLPPCPPKLPFLGNLHQLSKHPHRDYQTLSKRYGDVMLFHLGSIRVLVVSSERAAREILKTNEAIFTDRLITKKVKKLLYNGKGVTLSAYGEYWRRSKGICSLHLLSSKRVHSFRYVREEETMLFTEKILQQAAGGSSAINLTELFTDHTNNVICRVAFGRKYTKDDDGIDLRELIIELGEAFAAYNIGDVIPCFAWIDHFNGWNERSNRIATEFDRFIEMVIQEHRDRSVDHHDGTSINTDFVDILLGIQKDDTALFPLDTECLKAIIADMFIGGTVSTFTLLEWAMTELLRHPRVMQKVQKEVRDITKERSNVNEHELEKMRYLKAVIRETFRLHPPAPLLVPHQSTRDAKVHGYDIPADTVCYINVWAIQRDSAAWDEPDEFNPERFLNSEVDFRGRDFQFIPFGAGRRICPGIGFSTASIELLLANITNKFDWAIPEGETLDMSESFRISLHRKTPLLAVATSRSCI